MRLQIGFGLEHGGAECTRAGESALSFKDLFAFGKANLQAEGGR